MSIDINKLTFGSDDAERDAKYGFLDKVFLKTAFFNRVKSGSRELVIGRKGTGKSAICLMLKNAFESEGITAILITPQSLSYKKIQELKAGSVNKEDEYALSWKYVLLTKTGIQLFDLAKTNKSLRKNKNFSVMKQFLAQNGEIKKSVLEKMLTSLGLFSKVSIKIAGIEGSVEPHHSNTSSHDVASLLGKFQKTIQSLLLSQNDIHIVLVLDKIDEVWNEAEESGQIIIGLMKSMHELNSSLQNFQAILFIRSDIYDILKFSDADKFRSLEERLNWTEAELKRLITRRAKVSANLDTSEVDHIWNLIFPKTVRGYDSFEYIIDRTMQRPRELIQFCNCALAIAQDIQRVGIQEGDILMAEGQYSIWKLNDLASEFAVQYPFLEGLLGVFQGFKQRFSLGEFASRYSEVSDRLALQYTELNSLTTNQILQTLFIVGFLGAKVDGSDIYVYNEPKIILPQQEMIVIHPAYHLALGVEKYTIDIGEGEGVVIGGNTSPIVVGGDVVRGSKVVVSPETATFEKLLQDYRALLERSRQGISSVRELNDIERKFYTLRKRVELLKNPEANSDTETLNQFVTAIAQNLKQLDDLRDKLERSEMVNECIADFNSIIDSYKKNPISSLSELQDAQKKVQTIRQKAADVRKKLPRGSEEINVLDQLEDAIKNVERQLMLPK